jgi:hypothetical protein
VEVDGRAIWVSLLKVSSEELLTHDRDALGLVILPYAPEDHMSATLGSYLGLREDVPSTDTETRARPSNVRGGSAEGEADAALAKRLEKMWLARGSDSSRSSDSESQVPLRGNRGSLRGLKKGPTLTQERSGHARSSKSAYDDADRRAPQPQRRPEDPLESVMRGQGGQNPDRLLQLAMLKALERVGRHKGKKDRKDSQSSDSSASTGAHGSAAKSLKSARVRAGWVKKRPRRVIRKYLTHSRRMLQVEAYEPWKLKQVSGKIDWGRMRGTHRVHYYVSEALEYILADEVEVGAAFLCQLLRALHQMCLDGGGWEDAAAFLPGGDPLERMEFAGEESEVETIISRREALAKLRKPKPKKGAKDAKDDD